MRSAVGSVPGRSAARFAPRVETAASPITSSFWLSHLPSMPNVSCIAGVAGSLRNVAPSVRRSVTAPSTRVPKTGSGGNSTGGAYSYSTASTYFVPSGGVSGHGAVKKTCPFA